MSIESSFINLNRGNRLTSYMGLDLDEGVELKFEKGYTHCDIPIRVLLNADGTPVEKGLRNQHLRVIPACSVDLKGDYKLLVEPNPALSEFGSVQGMYYIQPGTGRQTPGFYITLRKDLDLSTVSYGIRLYMRI